MKNNVKRLISAILVLSTLTLSAVSCTGDEAAENGSKEVETIPVEEGITHTKHHGVPKYDWEGETFNSFYFSNGSGGSHYTRDAATYFYFTDEEASGDPIKEALWKRDELIVDYLNVNLTTEAYVGEEVASLIYNDIMAGLDSYQQVLTHCIFGVASLVSNNYLYDFNELPYVHIDEEWWDKDDMETLRLGRIYAYGRSDFTIPSPHVMIFNKTMVADLNLKNPYELVENYEWTLDEMITMAKAAVQDVDHDARYRGETDIFGICIPEISKLNSFIISCDQAISTRDENGYLQLALNTEKTVKIVEKFYELATTQGAIHDDMHDPAGVFMDKIFGEGRALFALYDPSFLDTLRSVDLSYGILPYPMFDEYQREYKSDDWGVLWCVPANIGNPDLVGSVVELYSYYSKDTIVPAYFDKVLEGKLVNDIESRRMLHIIYDSVSFDPINNYFGFRSGTEQLAFVLGKLVIEKSSKDFASYYKSNERRANEIISEFYSNLAKNGGA